MINKILYNLTVLIVALFIISCIIFAIYNYILSPVFNIPKMTLLQALGFFLIFNYIRWILFSKKI